MAAATSSSGAATAADASDADLSFPAHLQLDMHGLDLIQAGRSYVNTVLESVPGMKVLLLDQFTTSAVSVVFSHSEILEREVYLFDRIDKREKREAMPHLQAVCILRPEPHHIALLAQELQSPKYGSYHLFFTNMVSRQDLTRLASADVRQLVRKVQEVFLDYLAFSPATFSLNMRGSQAVSKDRGSQSRHALLTRAVEGISAILLATKRQPVIRYQKSSEECYDIAREMAGQMQSEHRLFHCGQRSEPPVLLILDRRADPATALLSAWTYQSMVHDLIGIDRHRVKVDDREIVLNPMTDEFYSKNQYLNWGELGEHIQSEMKKVAAADATHRSKLESINDMKQFLETYQDFSAKKASVSNHIALLERLLKDVDRRRLLEVSPVEQHLACSHDHSTALRDVDNLLRNPSLDDMERLKLIMLYALRYASHPDSDLTRLKSLLAASGMSEARIRLVDQLLAYSTAEHRPTTDNSWIDVVKSRVRATGLAGVENVFTQHTPLVMNTIDQLLKGKLDASLYPSIAGGATRGRPTQLIIFLVGGATFSEAQAVMRLNLTHPRARVVLGGTDFVNTEQFLKQVECSQQQQ